MRSSTLLLTTAFFLISVSSMQSSEPYEREGLWMEKTTISSICPSKPRDMKKHSRQIRSNQEIIDAAWAACARLKMMHRYSPKRFCPRVSKSIGKNIRKLPMVKQASESAINKIKHLMVTPYEGEDFLPHEETKIVLWRLKNSNPKETLEHYAVAEWVPCHNLCVPLGAVSSPKQSFLRRGSKKVYHKCIENEPKIQHDTSADNNYREATIAAEAAAAKEAAAAAASGPGSGFAPSSPKKDDRISPPHSPPHEIIN